jgi:hypothetical protein
MSHIPGLVAEVFSHERRILNLEEEDDLPFRRITPGARPHWFLFYNCYRKSALW